MRLDGCGGEIMAKIKTIPGSNLLLSKVVTLRLLPTNPPQARPQNPKIQPKDIQQKLRCAWAGLENPPASKFLQKWSTGVLKIEITNECLDNYTKVNSKKNPPNASLVKNDTLFCVSLPPSPRVSSPLQQYPPTDITGQLNLSDPSVSTVV